MKTVLERLKQLEEEFSPSERMAKLGEHGILGAIGTLKARLDTLERVIESGVQSVGDDLTSEVERINRKLMEMTNFEAVIVASETVRLLHTRIDRQEREYLKWKARMDSHEQANLERRIGVLERTVGQTE